MPYIGKSPTGSGVRQRYHFTATGGETSLSGADDNSKTLKFTDGEYVDVYLNGILLVQGTDYGVGTANTISSLAALAANDIVEVVVYDIYNVAKINSEAVRARHYYTATGGETSIGTSEISGLSFAANADIDVSLNGISLVAGTDYNTTTANTVGGLSALSAGNVVEIVIYEKFQLADALSKAAGGTVSGAVTASGGLNVGTIKEATGTTTAMTIDSSGRILTPARPSFLCRPSAALSQTTTGWRTLDFATVEHDIGSNLHADGYFVAPVDGVYHFNYGARFDNVNSGYIILALDHSTTGSPSSSSALYLTSYAINGSPFSSYDTVNTSVTIQLSADDKVVPWAYAQDTSWSISVISQFSGFLVG
jgi:hypothetical protein